jgi:hypothetical protein
LAERHPYKVDVAGSTPAAPTTLTIPKNVEVIEIPREWILEERIEFIDFVPTLVRVLRKFSAKRFENDLNGKRRTRSA